MELYFHAADKNVLVLSADGGLDGANAPEFLAQLEKLAASGVSRIVVDCSKLSYISSRGIATLVNLHRHMRSRGADVKVAAAHAFVLDVLRAARLDTVFDLHPDVERALLAFRGPGPRE